MSIPDVLEMTDFVSDEYAGDYTEEVLVKTGIPVPTTDNYYNVYIFPFVIKDIGEYVSDDASSGAALQVCLESSDSTVKANAKLQFYHATGDTSGKVSVRVYSNVGGSYSATNYTDELYLNTLYYLIYSVQWNDDNPDIIVCKIRISLTPTSDGTIRSAEYSGSDPTDIDRVTLNLLGWSNDYCRVQVWELAYVTNVPNTDLPQTTHHLTGYLGQMTAADFTATTTHGRLLTHWNPNDWGIHYSTDQTVDAAIFSSDNYDEVTDVGYGLEAIQSTNDDIETKATYTSETMEDIYEPESGEHHIELLESYGDWLTANDDYTLSPPTLFKPDTTQPSAIDMYGYDNAATVEVEIL